MTFEDGGTAIGTATLSDGTATFSTGALAVGSSHSITAVYAGGGNFASSTSPAITQVVTTAASATVVTASANPSVFGQLVTFTATVTSTAGTPTGTVTFEDGGTAIGTGTLSGGIATFGTTALTVGSGHSITAVYGGDASFAASTATALPQTVTQAATTTSVTASPNPAEVGQAVIFTATVAAASPGAGTPTGTVTFEDGGATIGTGTLSDGTATFTTSTLSGGVHSITAVYGADNNFTASTSTALSEGITNSATARSFRPTPPRLERW